MAYYREVPNSAPEDSLLNSLLEDYFDFKHFKNETQRNAIVKIMKRDSDVIVSLPKGHGRTTCFQLPIILCQEKVSIVVVGLSSRIKKQISRLNRHHVHVENIHAGTSSEEYDDIKSTINDLSTIRSTLNSILYVTPDVVPTPNFIDFLHHLNDNHSIGYIAIDISYCENYWSRGLIEERYGVLGLLRNEFIDTPWIVTTEKVGSEFVNNIKSSLLRTQRADIPRDDIPWFSVDIKDDDELLDR